MASLNHLKSGDYRHIRLLAGRSSRALPARKGELFIFAWIILVLFIQYTVNSFFIMNLFSLGAEREACAMLNFHIIHIAAGILFLYLLLFFPVSAVFTRYQPCFQSLPLSFPQRLSLELSTYFLSPGLFFPCIFLIPLILPFAALQDRFQLFGLIVLIWLACILSAWFLSILLPRFIFTGTGSVLPKILLAGFLLLLMYGNFSYQWEPGIVRVWMFTRKIVLDDFSGPGFLPAFFQFFNHSYVEIAVYLILAILISFFLSLGAVRLTFFQEKKEKKGAGSIKLSGNLEKKERIHFLIIKKETLALFRSRGMILWSAGIVFFLFFLIFTPTPSPRLAVVSLVFISFAAFSRSANQYGDDWYAVYRYYSAGLPWGKVVLGKMMSAVYFSFAGGFPFFFLSFLRFGTHFTWTLLITFSDVLLILLAYGNFSSILNPRRNTSREVLFSSFIPGAAWIFHLWLFSLTGSGVPGTYYMRTGFIMAVLVFFLWRQVRRIQIYFPGELETFFSKLE